MTRKLKDLIQSLSSTTYEDQIAHIAKVRSARHMERPVAAVKRVKREAKKKDKDVSTIKSLVAKLTPEQKAALIKKLGG